MIKLSGLFTLSNFSIVGTNTKLYTELSAGDIITIGPNSNILVKAIVSNNLALVNSNASVIEPTNLYVTRINSYDVEVNSLEASNLQVPYFDKRVGSSLEMFGEQYLVSDQVYSLTEYGTGGSGSTTYYLFDKFKLDNLDNATMSVPSSMHVVQHSMPQMYLSSDGSNKLSLMSDSYTLYEVTDSTTLKQSINGQYLEGLTIGQTLLLGSIQVKITDILDRYTAIIDTAIPAGFKGRISYSDNPADNFSTGDKVLVNGKINTVLSASSKSLMLDYQLPQAGNYHIRKPVISTSLGINTINLSEDLPTWFKAGDYLIIQYLEGQDTINELPIYRQCIRQIKKILTSKSVITTKDNSYKCNGVVNFATRSLGLVDFGSMTINATGTILSSTGRDLSKYVRINDLIIVENEYSKVTAVTSTSITLESRITPFSTDVQVQLILQSYSNSLTPELIALGLMKVNQQVLLGQKLFTSYNSLISKFKREFKFCVNRFASAPKLYTYSEPYLIALEQKSAPPLSFVSNYACLFLSENSKVSKQIMCLNHCGLPIVQKG